MKYEQKRFSVPASAGNAAYCAEHGHTMPDVRGKCLRCGTKIDLATFLIDNIGLPLDVASAEYERLKCLSAKTRGIPCS